MSLNNLRIVHTIITELSFENHLTSSLLNQNEHYNKGAESFNGVSIDMKLVKTRDLEKKKEF